MHSESWTTKGLIVRTCMISFLLPAGAIGASLALSEQPWPERYGTVWLYATMGMLAAIAVVTWWVARATLATHRENLTRGPD